MKEDFYVERSSKSEIKDLIYTHHYLKDTATDFRSGTNYGLFKHTEWDCPLRIGGALGACVFSPISGRMLMKGAFGLDCEDQDGIVELSRLCIDPEIQGEEHNITSWFVSRCIRQLRKDRNIRAILSYADSDHHTGTIYRACNFIYYGLTDSKTDFFHEDGTKHVRGPVKGMKGDWRPRSRKHRYLMIFDEELKRRLRWKKVDFSF
jgi:hypothetical protein